MKKTKFPKKAKLITFNGFYKIIKLEKAVNIINFPIQNKIEIVSMEFQTMQYPFSVDLVFEFEKVYKGYAQFRQTNFVKIK